MDLIVWHEPGRITHAEAAAKARFTAHPAVAEFAREVAEFVAGGDKKSRVLLSVKDSAVARVRYVAGKHRLVCYEPHRRAVLNPPLLRRSGACELSFCVGHAIDDPDPAHLAAAVHGLTAANWFAVLDDGDEHYVQVAWADGGYLLEVREGSADKHFQAAVSDAGDVIKALTAHAGGDQTWRDRFAWRPVAT